MSYVTTCSSVLPCSRIHSDRETWFFSLTSPPVGWINTSVQKDNEQSWEWKLNVGRDEGAKQKQSRACCVLRSQKDGVDVGNEALLWSILIMKGFILFSFFPSKTSEDSKSFPLRPEDGSLQQQKERASCSDQETTQFQKIIIHWEWMQVSLLASSSFSAIIPNLVESVKVFFREITDAHLQQQRWSDPSAAQQFIKTRLYS